MKRITLSTLGLALVLLAGCVVNSVYPYYTAKDVTFDPTLLGVWVDADNTNADNETWTFEQINPQTYKLIVGDKDKKTEFDARLFKLKDSVFLDCLPRERHDYTAPTHMLLRMDSLNPKLEMRLLDYEWLGKLVEKNPKTIRHIIFAKAGDKSDDQEFALTADTAELQKFIIKHVKTKEAWSDPLVMQRQ